jgi:hypothetical protein
LVKLEKSERPQRLPLRRRGPRALPLGELRLQESEELLRLLLPHHREERAVLLEAGGVEPARVLGAERFHVAPPALPGVRVRMSQPVPERHHRPRGHRAGLVEVALQRGHRAPPRRAHFALLEGGLERHLQQRVERALRQLGGHGQRQRRFLQRRIGRELRAHRLDQIVHVLRRPAPGAAAEQVDRELRQPGLPAGVLARARRQREPGVEERQPALLDGQQREPGGQLLDRQRRQRHVGLRAHGATSPGMSVTTLRRCGANVFCATVWIFAAVMAA